MKKLEIPDEPPMTDSKTERFIRVGDRVLSRLDNLAEDLGALTGQRWSRSSVARWLLEHGLDKARDLLKGRV